jgi:hypothetical protein
VGETVKLTTREEQARRRAAVLRRPLSPCCGLRDEADVVEIMLDAAGRAPPARIAIAVRGTTVPHRGSWRFRPRLASRSDKAANPVVVCYTRRGQDDIRHFSKSLGARGSASERREPASDGRVRQGITRSAAASGAHPSAACRASRILSSLRFPRRGRPVQPHNIGHGGIRSRSRLHAHLCQCLHVTRGSARWHKRRLT